MNEIIEKFVMKAYFIVLRNSQFPSVQNVFKVFGDIVEREALDILYSDINFKGVNQDIVSDILIKFRCAHSFSGTIYFDARNELFKDWDKRDKIIFLPEKAVSKEGLKVCKF